LSIRFAPEPTIEERGGGIYKHGQQRVKANAGATLFLRPSFL
jgi:hypothetical protein